MMYRTILPLGTLALTLALAISPAQAANVPDPVTSGANHELFLGIRATGGDGAGVSYLVDLGPASSFSLTEGTSFQLSLGNLGLDLAAVYGTEWYDRPDLLWGIFGTSTSPNSTVYASRERLNLSVQTDPWPYLGSDPTARNGTDSSIKSVLTGIGGYRLSTATANSPVATFQTNSTQPSSYAFQVGTAGTTDFGSLSQWGSIEGDFGAGTAGTILDLWRIDSTAVTYRGAFTIDDNGQITYTYSTVPEPTVSLLLGLTVFAAGTIRRRQTARPLIPSTPLA